jgi:hypothetical protein
MEKCPLTAKAEIRRPKVERNPKAESEVDVVSALAEIEPLVQSGHYSFRASGFGLLSVFGLRISDLVGSLAGLSRMISAKM